MRGFAVILLILPLLACSGCQTHTSPEAAKLLENEHPIDGLNRNVAQTEGGSIRDPYSLKPPPVRRDYADER